MLDFSKPSPSWINPQDLYTKNAEDERYMDLLLKARVLGDIVARPLPARKVVLPPEEATVEGLIADTIRRAWREPDEDNPAFGIFVLFRSSREGHNE